MWGRNACPIATNSSVDYTHSGSVELAETSGIDGPESVKSKAVMNEPQSIPSAADLPRPSYAFATVESSNSGLLHNNVLAIAKMPTETSTGSGSSADNFVPPKAEVDISYISGLVPVATTTNELAINVCPSGENLTAAMDGPSCVAADAPGATSEQMGVAIKLELKLPSVKPTAEQPIGSRGDESAATKAETPRQVPDSLVFVIDLPFSLSF